MSVHPITAHDGAAKYLATDRLRRTSVASRSRLEESLSDKARIITSTAFRRLQTKAQVFSLEQNAAVRSRLTHTLEVAGYGQLIASLACGFLKDKLSPEEALQLIQAVENACLLHDIGNPPFGHLGEFAICEWFRKQREELEKLWRQLGVPEDDRRNFQAAYEQFDGNPQGFRIVTRLQWLHDEFGLNLTSSLLAGMVKYPTGRIDSSARFTKKIGYFPTEAELVRQVWEKVGLKAGTRHPVAFLMEAADDIAYCVSDIEDAIEKRIVSQSQFFDSISPELRRRFDKNSAGSSSCSNARFIDFRIELTRSLIAESARIFADNYEQVLDGSFHTPLLDSASECESALRELKNFARKWIFVSGEAVNIELGGHRTVSDLLEGLYPLLMLSRKEFESSLPDATAPPDYGRLALERRLASLLPGKHRKVYQLSTRNNEALEPLYRTQTIVDYISGMTDNHAVQVHRMLRGAGDGIKL